MLKFLVFGLTFLGLLAGVVLSFFTQEELESGRKYFMMFEKSVLIFISLAIFFYVKDFFVLFIFGILLGLFFRKTYAYFGLALPLASGNMLSLLSSLVFIFGLPNGTLLAINIKDKKDIYKNVFISGLLFLTAITVSSVLNYSPLLMLCSGALIANGAGIFFGRE